MSTNGHATIQCERCDRNGFQTPEELAAHLRDSRDGHAMEGVRAQLTAEKAFAATGIDRRIAPTRPAASPDVLPPDTTNAPHHVCPKCETRIPCMWETIARVEQQAASLKMVAAKMRNRQLGLTIGGPKRNNAEWTDEDVYTAWRSGMSVRAIARLYSAGTPTIDKALKRAKENA